MIYLSKLSQSSVRVVCSCLLLGGAFGQVSAYGDQCGPAQYPPDNKAAYAFTIQSGETPGTCDPQVSISENRDTGDVKIAKFYPCSGDSYEITEIPGDLGGQNAVAQTEQALRSLCGANWVTQNFGQGTGNFLPEFAVSTRVAHSANAVTTTGQGSQSFAFTDLNGDGNPDIVYALANTVRVQLLNKDNSVLSSNTFPMGFSVSNKLATSLIAADFNGDNKLDLVITNIGTPGANSGGASILLGNGDGTFGPPTPLQAGLNPLSLVAADFNGDGKMDLAAANQSTGGAGDFGPGSVSVMLGGGNGTFAAPVTYITGEDKNGFPDSLIAPDLNGDGLPDLAMANRNDNSITVLINAGAGRFKPPSIVAVGAGVEYLAYSDLNHDGQLDLIATSSYQSALAVLLGKGDGTFQAPRMYATGDQPGSLSVLPLSDQYALLITADSLAGSQWMTMVSPQAAVGAPRLTSVGGMLSAIAAADLNGDGQPDAVILGGSNDLSVVLSSSSGYGQPVAYSLNGSSPQAVAIADVDNDGKPDVVAATGAGSLYVLRGNGDGSLRAPVPTAALPNATGLTLADFNHDGKLDAAIAAYGSGISVLSGNGDGTFAAPLTLTVSGINFEAVAAADLNGDGILDLAAVGAGTPGKPAILAVFLGQGGGKFQTARTITLQTLAGNEGGVAIGDFNGDGKPDIAAFSNYSQTLDVLLNDGSGGFREAPSLPLVKAANSAGLVLADLNGDGKLDIVTTGSFLPGNGDGTFQPELQFAAASFTTSVAPVKFGANPGLISVGQAGGLVTVALVTPVVSPLSISANTSAASATVTLLTPSSIATAYGAGLATGTDSAGSGPIPTTLAQTTVTVTDSTGSQIPAPLFYVSAAQVNYEVPANAALGQAQIAITNGNGNSGSAAIRIVSVAPAVFALDAAGLIAADAIIAVNGAQQLVNVYQSTTSGIAPLPLDVSSGQVYLAIYATGIRNAKSVTATAAGKGVPVLFWGAQGAFAGLDQVNIGPLPASLAGSGQINIVLSADGQVTNTVNLTVQ